MVSCVLQFDPRTTRIFRFPFPRENTKRIQVRAVGSLFSFLVSLLVPIIFPGNGDLWGSYGRGLPTLSNVTFQVRKKQQIFHTNEEKAWFNARS